MRELELALLHSSRSTKPLDHSCPRLEEQQPCTPRGTLPADQRGRSLPRSPPRRFAPLPFLAGHPMASSSTALLPDYKTLSPRKTLQCR